MKVPKIYRGGVLLKKQCFRIFNLMKVYWIIFSIAFVGIFVGLKYQFKEIYSSCIDFCADFIGMAYLYGGDTLNGAWWYMTVIIIAYLVFPIIRYMGEKIKGLVITLCTGIIIIFMLFFPIGGDAGKLDFIIWLVPFMMGVLWSQNKRKLSGLLNLSKARIILINVFILLLCLVRLKLHTYNFDSLLASAFIILLMNFSIWENGILGKMLEIFGRHSYIIYLFHSFLIVYLSKWVYIWKIPIIVYIIFSVVCLCISVILDRIVKLCFRWRNKNEYKKCQN